MNRRKYVPKVPQLHQVCEVNYANLVGLLPDCDTANLKYEFRTQQAFSYAIAIVETSRYTSLLEVEQTQAKVTHYSSPKMRVRLYHDARMAEVVSVENIGDFKASYGYPNEQMHQVNEKEMVNYFLAEWIAFCLRIRAAENHIL